MDGKIKQVIGVFPKNHAGMRIQYHHAKHKYRRMLTSHSIPCCVGPGASLTTSEINDTQLPLSHGSLVRSTTPLHLDSEYGVTTTAIHI